MLKARIIHDRSLRIFLYKENNVNEMDRQAGVENRGEYRDWGRTSSSMETTVSRKKSLSLRSQGRVAVLGRCFFRFGDGTFSYRMLQR